MKPAASPASFIRINAARPTLKRRDQAESRTALRMAVGMIALAAPLQLVAGHISGEVAHEHQPSKLAFAG